MTSLLGDSCELPHLPTASGLTELQALPLVTLTFRVLQTAQAPSLPACNFPPLKSHLNLCTLEEDFSNPHGESGLLAHPAEAPPFFKRFSQVITSVAYTVLQPLGLFGPH